MTHERIKHEEEVLKLAWASALAVGSGTAALMVGELTLVRLSFAAIGLIFTLTLLVFTVVKDMEIKQATEEE